MSAKDDGGPAFPLAPCGTGDPRDGMAGGSEGMTLRDWFAGMALQGIIASGRVCVDHADAARDAYCYADAMLAAREKGGA